MINNIKVEDEKKKVSDFWNQASCGEELYLKGNLKEDYISEAINRYSLEPYIPVFADFGNSNGKRVLEIGVGLGADHQQFSSSGAILYGIDLTERAVNHTKHRLNTFGLNSILNVGDAEKLDFQDDYFDIIYSWGVLHHSPDTPKAIQEVYRVLKPGGVAKIMIYHKWSMVGVMLWFRYAFLNIKPLMSLKEIYSQYLESPGTKAYSISEAKTLFSGYSTVNIVTQISHGDLLSSLAGQRHKGIFLDIARKFWPRWFIKKFLKSAGLFMLIEAKK